jgi:uncharacterized membrane protein YkvA (DUF1232 family)
VRHFVGKVPFTQDASVVAVALTTIGMAVTEEHRQRAKSCFEK